MVRNEFEHSATSKSPMRSRSHSMLARKLGAILLASLLVTGCAHQGRTPTVGTVDIKNVQCWPKRIAYSKKDTQPTIGQIREHNATGRNIGCW